MADLTGAHAVMALAHLAAAVLVGLWLAVGERALWHLRRAGRRRRPERRGGRLLVVRPRALGRPGAARTAAPA